MTLKIAAFLLLVLALGLGAWYFHHEAYKQGVTDGTAATEAKYAAQAKVQAAANAKKLASNQTQADAIDKLLQPQVQTIYVQGPTVVKTVKEAVDADPTYAACVPPPALVSMRASALKAIAAAANESPVSATSSAPAVSRSSP